MASSDDEDYAGHKIKPDASTKTEDEGGCRGDKVNRAGGMRNVTCTGPSHLFHRFFDRDAIFCSQNNYLR